MRPWEAEGFEWDEANESELADPRHPIQPWEVEQVFWNVPVWAPNRRGRSGDRIMVGRTDGGRRLTIVVQVKGATRQLRPITGWPSTQAELSKYGRGKRR
jgi:uncharacterized DUF497 family protein